MLKNIAIIDLGSSSFHLSIFDISNLNDVKTIKTLKKKVRLRDGLREDNSLSEIVKIKALECLKFFRIALDEYNVKNCKVVGTYTLRQAQNSLSNWLEEANIILGHPVEVISGNEEARLVYLGSTFNMNISEKTLVIDIGGGSTEIIIGLENNIIIANSLNIGCVEFQNKFFADRLLSEYNFTCAIHYAKKHINTVLNSYLNEGYFKCIGSSGTIRSMINKDFKKEILNSKINNKVIDFEFLKTIKEVLIDRKEVNNLDNVGLRKDRQDIFAGGFCILYALFELLKIKELSSSNGAIREGLLREILEVE